MKNKEIIPIDWLLDIYNKDVNGFINRFSKQQYKKWEKFIEKVNWNTIIALSYSSLKVVIESGFLDYWVDRYSIDVAVAYKDLINKWKEDIKEIYRDSNGKGNEIDCYEPF